MTDDSTADLGMQLPLECPAFCPDLRVHQYQ
jgi:hypothetical protein